MMDFDQECINDFVEESIENLDMLDDSFVQIEKDPDDSGELDNIFRAVHTLKGGCRLIGMERLEEIAHTAETLLDLAREKDLRLEVSHITLMLKTIDVFRYFIDGIRQTGQEPDGDFSALVKELSLACEKQSFSTDHLDVEAMKGASSDVESESSESKVDAADGSSPEVPPEVAPESSVESSSETADAEQVQADQESAEALETSASSKVVVEDVDDLDWTEGLSAPPEKVFKAKAVEEPESGDDDTALEAMGQSSEEQQSSEVVEEAVVTSTEPVGETPESVEAPASLKDEPSAPVEPSSPPATSAEPPKRRQLAALKVDAPVKKEVEFHSAGAAESTIRIDVRRLDKLMDLVGELVLSRNQLKQVNGKIEDPALNGTTNAISLITSELQEEIVKSRLQPISSVVNKFQRTVRDLALSLNKKVDLDLRGVGTELDRTLLESIKDPLTHLIRNAVDHGIETPEVRKSKGKPEEGTIGIHCFHDGGQVMISIKDDGAGLDHVKIGQKAMLRKLVTKDQLDRMSPREVYRFIFHPGFSTAEQVTSISGRGVGMDVVHTNITSIGGQIDLDSVLGKESTVRLQIPLTLAIIPALMVTIDQRYFAIPQSSLQELIFVDRDDYGKIEQFDGTEFYRLRGQLLPLLRLRPMMNIEEVDRDYVYIVVLVTGEQKIGLLIDEVEDTEEIVVKPLAKFFNSVRFFSGATILGDGSISLILDVEALAHSANIKSTKSITAQATSIARTKAASTALLFNLGGEEVFGIQMSQISRLEEIKMGEIEMAGSQEVIQYRGEILPVVRLSRHMDIEEHLPEDGTANLIVFYFRGRETGLIVRDILDANALEGELDTTVIEDPLILGTMMLKNQIVLMLDALKVFELSFKRWGASKSDVLLEGKPKPRLLYVDDSTFYLKVVGRYLQEAGYEVDTAIDGLDGLSKIKNDSYDLLIIDYEMPNMDGLELISKVRELIQYDLVPIIVLTALTSGQEKFTLINSGIQSYLVKLNKEELLDEVNKLLQMEVVEI